MNASDRSYALSTLGLDAVHHPDHQQFLTYWLGLKGDTEIPLRNRFDPLDLPALLPRIAVIEVTQGDPEVRFRYRLAGTEIVARAGRDPTGKYFEELYQGAYLESAMSTYRDLLVSGMPHYSQRVFPIGNGVSDLRYDRLILPFSSDGTEVTQFVLLIVVVEQTGRPVQTGSFRSYGSN